MKKYKYVLWTAVALFLLFIDMIPGFDTEIRGIPLWQYVGFLSYLILAFIVAKVIVAVLFSRLRKCFPQTDESKLSQIVLAHVCKPVQLILSVILLKIGLELCSSVYHWPDWMMGMLNKVLVVAVAVSVTYTIIKLVDIYFAIWGQKKEIDPMFKSQVIPLLNRVVKCAIILVSLLMITSNLGINISSVLAVGSVGGLAFSLAFQDLLNNMFSGIVIFLDKPFQLGDRIVVEGRDGVVESIGLRSTRIRSFLDGYLVSIPNKTICNTLIENISKRPSIKTEINIGVTYGTSADKLKRAIDLVSEVYRNNPQTVNLVVNFNKFNDFALNIQVVHWNKAIAWALYVKNIESMNLELKHRFDEEQIEFAYPTQTLYMKQDSNWQVNNTNNAN
ncbi:MAG: mechanosensitive ion channel family protein [Verrucomicrobia bacterium]|nr:mechanosensitive ion channel family protein [Verrucomicrobiota bacterium]MBP5760510.1 mechanosensitive ion channel family protein [Verrucomicrobiota bacterium]